MSENDNSSEYVLLHIYTLFSTDLIFFANFTFTDFTILHAQLGTYLIS